MIKSQSVTKETCDATQRINTERYKMLNNKIDAVNETIKGMDTKLDKVIEEKADKTEVADVWTEFNSWKSSSIKWIGSITGAIILTLIAIVGWCIEYIIMNN